ncbi:MAG: ATP-binding protein [Bacteroidales bacterium]|nr:ATP-binding protein [Lentimicrobiaceae bacterium]MDD5695125.1 ATP-binding protein [Bacteroidales bacterium]
MIKRLHINQLKGLSESYPVVAVLGPRQVGKTTLVKEYIKTIERNTIYLDLEKPSQLEMLDQPERYFQSHLDDCLVLDEVQNKPDIFPVMRSMIDQKRVPQRFIILGSASPRLLRQSSESLAGRIAYLELPPLSLLEVGAHSPEVLEKHHFFGGFPLSWIAPSREESLRWLDFFIESYVSRDLRLLGLNVTPPVLRRFWEMVAWQNGGMVNLSSIGKSLGLSHPTIGQYLDFFEQAFLLKRVFPYSFNVKKRVVKTPKIYLTDTGVLHRLLRIRDHDQLLGFPGSGFSWEAYVINQIVSLRSSDLDIYFYRTHNGAETDLLLTKGLQPVSCIEIKFTDAPRVPKGFEICIDDLKTRNNFIICPSVVDYQARNTIRVCSLYTFLEKYLPEL